ncbi:MAG: exo 1,3/1,4-beta-D-glucan glucohydrolase [Thermoanaerobaculia bacterium]
MRTRILVAATLLTLAIPAVFSAPPEHPRTTTPPPVIHPNLWPVVPSPVASDPQLERKVSDLLARMSVEEKVGQVIQAEILHVTPDDVRRYHLGSVLSGGDSHPNGVKHTTPADWVAVADAFWDASMTPPKGGVAIPIIWGADAVHGHSHITGATIFPHNVGLGATHDPDLIRRVGEVTAREMAVTGLDWDFGPTVAVVRNDRWGRTYEGYSEDPEIVRAYAAAMVRGLQGDPGTPEFLDAYHVISTAKHFLGDGGNLDGRDQGDNLSTEKELRDIHGAGYVGALGEGVQTVMASFSSWHGRKMHGNHDLLTAVLKDRMGFDGFVVGDWNAHGQLEGCTTGNCAAAFNAGVDMFMVPEDWKELWTNTLAQVNAGVIPMARLDDAVRRILRVKMRAGLFDRGKPSSRPLAGKSEELGSAGNRAVAARAVRESLVLLKNSGHLLPLRRDQRVAVVGRGANSIPMQTGGWTLNWQGSGNVNSDFPGGSSIWDGIRAAVEASGGTAILAEEGNVGAPVDVAIAVFGEEPYAEFRGDLDTIEYQRIHSDDGELLRKLKKSGVKVVSIFLSGRPLWVNPEFNASDAFVAAWLPGTEGSAVADVLFRKADGEIDHDFHGKLAYSWPRSISQTVLNRGDAKYDPLFAYGFGLTYADDGALPQLPESTGNTTADAVSRTVYFDAGPVAPWRVYVGDDQENPALEVVGTRTSTVNSTRLVVQPVDRAMQSDALRARWDGSGKAWLFIQAATPVDLTRESNGELALSFDVFIEQPPKAKTILSMGCGEECRGSVDVSAILRTLPPREWKTVRIRLRCLEEAGAEMTRINRPLQISTDGTLGLRLSNVRLVPASEGKVLCPPRAEKTRS